MLRWRISTEPGSEQDLESVLILGDEVVQVVLIQSFGAEQRCSSKHLDRTSTSPGSELIHRLNSLIDIFNSLLLLHFRWHCQVNYR